MPRMAAPSDSRDRRMDIAAICDAVEDAYELEVQTQRRQMSHHSSPLYRAEQDRIHDREENRNLDWQTRPHTDSYIAFKPSFLIDNPHVRTAIPPKALVPTATTSLAAYAPPQIPLIHPRARSQPRTEAPTPSPNLSSAAVSSSSGMQAPIKKRSRRMSNSERGKLYRSRRKNYVDNLEGEVQELKQEVQGLQVYGSILQEMVLHTPQMNGGSYSRVVSEYFTLFESGLPLLPDHADTMQASGAVELRPSVRQSVFVNTLMEANMAFCGNGGTKRLLQNWEFFSRNHASLNYRLTKLRVILPEPTAVVSADAVLRVRLTRITVEKMFPHVLWNEALVQKLVGLEVEYAVGNRFYFSESGKIYKYESEVDFLATFMTVLGSIQDAILIAGPITQQQQRAQSDTDQDGSCSSSNGSSTEGDNDHIHEDVGDGVKSEDGRDTE